MSELNLVIIWEKARYKQEDIIFDISEKFTLFEILEIEWGKDKFHENLTRFYGQKLPKGSHKEKHCGNGPFVLVIFSDENPVYDYRETSRGQELVNVNLFDQKILYREWTNGGHKIHTTNGNHETAHDLMLLTGENVKSYLRHKSFGATFYKGKNNIQLDLVGSSGWNNLKKMFNSLNGIVNYVVMRNFDQLPSDYKVHSHGDIDLLTDDRTLLISMLNAKKSKRFFRSAAYEVLVNNEMVPLDIRQTGDNYYCKKWQNSVLKNSSFCKGVCIPSDEDHRMMLIYHALLHKVKISSDYFSEIVSDGYSLTNCMDELKRFMNYKEYNFCVPKDISVYFNFKNFRKFEVSSNSLDEYGFFHKIIRKIRQVVLVDSRIYLKKIFSL